MSTLKMTAKASSVLNDHKSLFDPQFAIDGKISKTHVGFFHSKGENNPWLEINFNECKTVALVSIKHRRDKYCCPERFSKAKVSLYVEENGRRTNKAQVNVDGPAQHGQLATDFKFKSLISANGLRLELDKSYAMLEVFPILKTFDHYAILHYTRYRFLFSYFR